MGGWGASGFGGESIGCLRVNSDSIHLPAPCQGLPQLAFPHKYILSLFIGMGVGGSAER
jgi:hypothetical protein